MQEPRPEWWEGTNGADINNRPDRTTHNSFTPTTGAKGNVLTKDSGFDSRQAAGWVWRVTAVVSEGCGNYH